ncbi:hypothetical protein FJZ26_04825 [Candidatus Parvarchaeota archaeon]|nr:hypothetical protein [Candidatus Parvarchaeota archaeon]
MSGSRFSAFAVFFSVAMLVFSVSFSVAQENLGGFDSGQGQQTSGGQTVQDLSSGQSAVGSSDQQTEPMPGILPMPPEISKPANCPLPALSSEVEEKCKANGMEVKKIVDSFGCAIGFECAAAGQNPQMPPTRATNCGIDDGLAKQLNSLISQVQDERALGKEGTYEGYKEKIEELSKKIASSRKGCTAQNAVATRAMVPVAKGLNKADLEDSDYAKQAISMKKTEAQKMMNPTCAQLSQFREKLDYYEKISSSQVDSSDRQGLTREMAQKAIEQLKLRMSVMEKNCNREGQGNAQSDLPGKPQLLQQPGTEIYEASQAGPCMLLKAAEQKKERLTQLSSLSEENLKEKGLKPEDLERMGAELSAHSEKLRVACAEGQKPVLTGTRGAARPANCIEFKTLISQRAQYLKQLQALGEEDLKAKGYSAKQLEKFSEEIRKMEKTLEEKCSSRQDADSQELEKPIAATSGMEISDYFKLKVKGIMESEKPAGEKIEKLKSIRGEIDSLISDLLKSHDKIDAGELAPVVSEIEVRPTEISADNVKIDSTSKELEVEVEDQKISIGQQDGAVVVGEQNGLKAKAQSLKLKNNELHVGDRVVRVLPAQLAQRIKGDIKSLDLAEEKNMAVYKAKVQKSARLFGFIPTSYEKTEVINAESGEKVSEEKPWWGAIATESE